MPDWKQIVRQNLRVLAVCPPEFTEELAAHLEDSYEASVRGGRRQRQRFNTPWVRSKAVAGSGW